jgi:hypothetical protein
MDGVEAAHVIFQIQISETERDMCKFEIKKMGG